MQEPPRDPARFQVHHRPWKLVLAVVAAFLLILFGFFGYTVFSAYRRVKSGDFDAGQYATQRYTAGTQAGTTSLPRLPRDQVETTDDPSLGPADALVTIVEFGDFECPFCREAFPTLKDLLREYSGRIRFIYRDFPNTSLHPNAMNAALAAACADAQGKFWAYHDLIYLNQEQLSVRDLERYAEQAGAEPLEFARCLSERRSEKEIEGDVTAGLAAGVGGTPTWFVNGYRIQGVLPFDVFKKIVEFGLEGKL